MNERLSSLRFLPRGSSVSHSLRALRSSLPLVTPPAARMEGVNGG